MRIQHETINTKDQCHSKRHSRHWLSIIKAAVVTDLQQFAFSPR